MYFLQAKDGRVCGQTAAVNSAEALTPALHTSDFTCQLAGLHAGTQAAV
jgi:hypothetical protein